MASEIKMPASGQTAAESVIVAWHVEEGDAVERGDILFDIETDKATLSVESYAKGTVLKRLYGEGDKVEAGKVVAYIGGKDETIPGTQAEKPRPVAEEDEYRPIMPGTKEKTAAKDSPCGGAGGCEAGVARGAEIGAGERAGYRRYIRQPGACRQTGRCDIMEGGGRGGIRFRPAHGHAPKRSPGGCCRARRKRLSLR